MNNQITEQRYKLQIQQKKLFLDHKEIMNSEKKKKKNSRNK